MEYIKEYQIYKDLVPDGILGKNTLLCLRDDLGINEIIPFSHFLGQLHHESAGFTKGRENLNYSAEALKQYFSKYFKDNKYSEYARNPEKIGNRIYANRMGNGDEVSGDGWRNRGVGPIQLTGKNNISGYLKYTNLPDNSDPDILLLPKYYFDTAKYFFDRENIWKYTKDISKSSSLNVSRIINLGNVNSTATPLGLIDRDVLTLKYYKILNNSLR